MSPADTPTYVSLVRNRVIRVQSMEVVVARLDELETGVPEHLRQAPALHAYLDEFERDVMALVAARLED
ncbi:MAG: hypothetical protein ACXWXO_13900 [Nocardioides sp.]